MTNCYHFLQGTNVVGPLQLEELKSLIQKGVVSGQTMLSDDATNWKPGIELVPQLFGRSTTGQSSPSGAEQWYVQSNGQEYGPISYTELLGWTGAGSVIAETLVRKSAAGAWQRADSVFPHLGLRSLTPRVAKPGPNATSNKTDLPRPGSGFQSTVKKGPTPASSNREAETSAEQVFAVIGIVALVGVVYVGTFYFVFVGLPQLRQFIGPGGMLLGFLIIYGIRYVFSKKSL